MKKAVRVLAFLVVFTLVYGCVNVVLKLKTDDGINVMRDFYTLPADTVDVLAVGSSHLGMNIDPAVFWDDHGIAEFNLWSGMQPIWNSYYFIKEAFKYQNPKLVILEIFLSGADYEYSDSMAAIKSVESLRFSMDKIEAAFASFSTWQQAVEAIWGLPTYHERYTEISKDDFSFNITADKVGIQQNTFSPETVYPLEFLDYKSIKDVLPLSKKSEEYLQKTIDLCKAKNVGLLLLLAPFQATEDECKRLNTVERIAEQRGIPFLNMLKNYSDAGIAPQSDFYDIGHLNTSGIPKFSRFISDYINDKYDLPDRREDAGHLWYGKSVGQITVEPDYKLKECFMGDGVKRNVDTGVKLYNNMFDSWTLLTRLDTKSFGDDEVYLSCFSELIEAGNYGLLVKKKSDKHISVKLGANIETEVTINGDTVDIVIVKDMQTYAVYANGVCITQNRLLECPAYQGNLLVGCQELSPGGEKFRFSKTRVLNLEVYMDEVLDAATIQNWSPEALPEPALPLGQNVEEAFEAYSLPEQFLGGDGRYRQESYIDTGLAPLCDDATRFTLFASVTPQKLAADNVFLSCFSEETDNYRGILLRQASETEITIVYGNNRGLSVPCEIGSPIDIAVVKDANIYSIYVDGELLVDRETAPTAAYAGNLLVGCQQTAEGEIFRVSKTRVNSLTVLSGVADEKTILAWPYLDAPLPPERVATSVDYTLEKAFVGDGTGRYIDTGVKLFDASNKDWTLETTLAIDKDKQNGVYLSCFSEETGRYRGFMLRQDEPNKMTLWVGGGDTYTFDTPTDSRLMRLVLVKSGSVYALYQNGAFVTRIESDCDAYDGNLLVGCQETAQGEKFRFSASKINELKLSNNAVSDEQAKTMSVPSVSQSRFG